MVRKKRVYAQLNKSRPGGNEGRKDKKCGTQWPNTQTGLELKNISLITKTAIITQNVNGNMTLSVGCCRNMKIVLFTAWYTLKRNKARKQTNMSSCEFAQEI